LPGMAKRRLDHVAETGQHIAQTRVHIARQHEVIEQRARDGHPVNLAVELLNAVETFERHRAIILKQRKPQP
jgi:hypothetical protein